MFSATAAKSRLKGVIRHEFRKKVLGLRLRSISLGLRLWRRCLDDRLMLQGHVRGRVTAAGSKVDGLGTVRAWTMNRVSEITTGLISSPDRHAVRWAPLILILGDVPHWKIIRRDVVYGVVVLIAIPNRPS